MGTSVEKFMRLLTCNIQHILLGTTLHTLYLPCHLLFLFALELDNVCLKPLEAPCCNQLYWSSRKIVNNNAFIVIKDNSFDKFTYFKYKENDFYL